MGGTPAKFEYSASGVLSKVRPTPCSHTPLASRPHNSRQTPHPKPQPQRQVVPDVDLVAADNNVIKEEPRTYRDLGLYRMNFK